MRFEVRRPTGPPEDSVAMRVVVACAVEVAIAAVVAQPGAVPASVAAASLLLAPAGYWYSYRRRRSPNLLLKVALSVALLAALGQFLGDVRGVVSVDQARIPLASLFLWVQVLHAFDVPRRRDLAFSMVSSLILIAEAGSLSLSTSFLVFLLPWAGLSGAWLSMSSRPRADRVTTPEAVRRIAGERAPSRTASIRSATAAAGLVLLAASLVFLAMPRLPGGFVRTPPFSLAGNPSPVAAFDGAVSNPGLAALPGSGVVDFSSGGYPGFSDVVDLRSRGRLVRRSRLPGACAAGRALAGGGLRPLRREPVDDHRRRDRGPAGRRRRPLGRRARRCRAAEHGPRRGLVAGGADVLHRGAHSPTCSSRPRAPGRCTSPRRACGSTPGGRSARRSCSTRGSSTPSCRRCRSPTPECCAAHRRGCLPTRHPTWLHTCNCPPRCPRASGNSRGASRADGQRPTTE